MNLSRLFDSESAGMFLPVAELECLQPLRMVNGRRLEGRSRSREIDGVKRLLGRKEPWKAETGMHCWAKWKLTKDE